jgi:hypothetical protein
MRPEDLPGRWVTTVRREIHRPLLRREDGALVLVTSTYTHRWVRGNFIGEMRFPVYPDSRYVAGIRDGYLKSSRQCLSGL